MALPGAAPAEVSDTVNDNQDNEHFKHHARYPSNPMKLPGQYTDCRPSANEKWKHQDCCERRTPRSVCLPC